VVGGRCPRGCARASTNTQPRAIAHKGHRTTTPQHHSTTTPQHHSRTAAQPHSRTQLVSERSAIASAIEASSGLDQT
jgi:hypothetical protein